MLAQDTKQLCQMWKHHKNFSPYHHLQVPCLLLTSSCISYHQSDLLRISGSKPHQHHRAFRSRCSGTNQYSPHTPAVEAASISLKWHLRLLSEHYSVSPNSAHSSIQGAPPGLHVFTMMSVLLLRTSPQSILRYLFIGFRSAAENKFSAG